MGHEDKKQTEALFMDFFRTIYPEFPKGKLIPSESPDFIVKINNRKSIGMELTRLYPHGEDKSHFHPDAGSEEMVFISRVRDLTEQHFQMPLFVKFFFVPGKNPEKAAILSASLMVAVKIRTAIKQTNDSPFRVILRKQELPAFLENVLIMHHPVMNQSLWEKSRQEEYPRSIPDEIMSTIRKKEEKLVLYQTGRHNQYWLIIIADQLQIQGNLNIYNKIANHGFASKFQKVILLELVHGKFYDLV